MVRAGVVRHPDQWVYGGYHEIQNPKQRYALVNRHKLAVLLGIKDNDSLSEYHCNWVEQVSLSPQSKSRWMTSITSAGQKPAYAVF